MTASTRGRRNRQRGQEGEREAVAFLREHGVGCEDRLLGQERDGGYDLDTEAGPCDVKRRKKLPAYMIPREGVAFVMARQDYKRWYVVLDAEAWCRLWLRDAERTAYHGRSCPLCAQREAPAQCWLCAAASRIAAGEPEAEVMADFGWVREDAPPARVPAEWSEDKCEKHGVRMILEATNHPAAPRLVFCPQCRAETPHVFVAGFVKK